MGSALTVGLETPPGPKGNWLTGSLPAFRRDRLGFLTECAQTYGDVVAFRLGPRKMMLVNHPDLVEEVLVTNNRHYIKHFALRMTEKTLGNGLLTSESDFWRRQRRLAQPAFHRERIAGHAEVMVAFTERMLQTWSSGQVRDVQEAMMRLTLEIIAKTLFDADVSAESAALSAAMETTLRSFTERVNHLVSLPDFIPTPGNLRLARAVKRLDAIIFEMIARRRASGEDRGDLLSMLLNAQDENNGDRMTDRQLRDEAMTLFMAGHETTANTLTWAWYLLAQHPEVEARLHEELDQVLGDRAPTLADLPRLSFTEHVITESLRVHPTVWLLGREAIVPTVVGRYPVPVGMTVYMSQWVVHRDPRFFEDPESFRPERWQDGLMKRIPRYAYFPFGGGPRICIGNSFAMMEAVLLLATIARRFRLGLEPGTKAKLLPTMTLRADGGIPMVLSSRR
ncbi:cytochrome P450 [Singulisphaera acidiphila]|uniref:Cytochrome P450 n=1 Tax=Singulisphaera acidiphila (strain ATCC BAA-1392 / DSM 18658 / VKM B-2454 / MOB10) TaxID=886293 RepID=L0DII2_SINAD|nr:cytochrome P450 [Singulisphaera acidiphila]AGA29067.1 cytochrome P450 [Singulisphaera acidiphila DSM 18658]